MNVRVRSSASRPARLLLGFVVIGLLGVLLSACGTPPSGDLAVSVTANDGTDIQPGDTPSFTVSVVNNGTTAATGVSLRVDLPAEFLYKSTTSISGEGDAQTLPVDAATNSPTPVWGSWSLAAPSVDADGTRQPAHVDITFVVDAQGQPGDYLMSPKASSDASEGLVSGAALAIHVSPSTQLGLAMVPLQATVTPGQTLDYRVIVTNDGSGAASNVDLLITLPPTLNFLSTVKVSGNSGRSDPTDPFDGAVVPFYGGFIIPARSTEGPGLLAIEFRVVCVAAATGGTFGTTAQLTDADGTIVRLSDVAPVTVDAPTPSPVPTFTPNPGTRTPAPQPAPYH